MLPSFISQAQPLRFFLSKSSRPEVFCKNGVLKAEACNFNKKETLAQVFSCKFWEIFKNISFYRTPLGDCFCEIKNLHETLTSLEIILTVLWCVTWAGTIYTILKTWKNPWRSVTFSNIAGFYPATLLKVTLLHGCFSRFLNCTNGTKSRNASHVFKYKYCQPNEKVLLIGHNSKCGF